MKTAAVICEFNPFHNGHAYILKQARELTGADYIIAIMSGNYVQRGEPAIFDKYTRTQMALKAGADLVIELPQVFAVSSAMEFARAGVITAIKTGVVDYLVFGTEFDADIEEMKKCAGYLLNESSEFQQRIKELVKTGISYPAAREQALSETSDINADYLKSSNNILALSYISALIEENSSIIPVPVKRLGDGYNEIFAKDDHYASATAIRNILLTASSHPNSAKKINKLLTSFIPSEVFELYLKAIEESGILNPAYINKSERLNFILGWRLIEEAAKDDPSFRAYNDVSKEISDRLINTANTFTTMSGRIQAVKTKQYTYSRIQRALLHILLNITDEEVVRRKETGYIEYLRVLGFKKNAAELMKQIKKSDYREACPMITNAADYRQLLKDDILRDNIYYSLDAGKGILNKSECERQIIIL